jgi:hypothetical protein
MRRKSTVYITTHALGKGVTISPGVIDDLYHDTFISEEGHAQYAPNWYENRDEAFYRVEQMRAEKLIDAQGVVNRLEGLDIELLLTSAEVNHES